MAETAFQDQISDNHCFGCGPDNSQGLQLKSYWSGKDTATCTFLPSAHHSAGPTCYLNGGIIATIIDCHCICTAIAKGYQMAGREIGHGEKIWFATGKLEVNYLKPAAIDSEVYLTATIIEARDKKIILDCTVSSQGQICATARVIAIKVPNDWAAK